jgi:hypothetical protein
VKDYDKVGCILFAVTIFCAFMAGWTIGQGMTRQQAIEAGVAEWRIDSQAGKTRFEWLSPEGE